MRLIFGEWLPDQASLAGGSRALNVLPATGGYRPVSGLAAYSSNALDARIQGGAAFQDSAGNVNIFAGTASKLWRMAAGSSAFADVSGSAYTTSIDERWWFVAYQNRVVAGNFNDNNQLYTLTSSSTFGNLNTASPKARCAAIVKNFLMLGNCNEATFGAVPESVWWSVQGDVTAWPAPGSTAALAGLSDRRVLAGRTGAVLGLLTGLPGVDALVVCQLGLYRGSFVPGDPQIFTFDLVEGGRGCAAAGSLVSHGGFVYYLAEDGFYRTNGVQSEGIGASKVDKFFFTDPAHAVDQTLLYRISGLADPINKCVFWSYPSASGQGQCDKVIVFNFETGAWSLVPGLPPLDLMMPIRSLGYSIDSLDTLYSSIDAIPFSLDSRQFTGGRPLIGAFTTDHILQAFSGQTLAASVTLAEQSHPSTQVFGTSEVRPLVQAAGDAAVSAVITYTPASRNRLNDAIRYGAAVGQNSNGFFPVRTAGRYLGGQVDIAAGGGWAMMLGVDVPDDKIVTLGR